MIHEKELSIVEVNERRDKLIDVSVTDALQQKVRRGWKYAAAVFEDISFSRTNLNGTYRYEK